MFVDIIFSQYILSTMDNSQDIGQGKICFSGKGTEKRNIQCIEQIKGIK